MKVYAHRGASKEFPENTIEAFRGALRHGVFGVELDVHLSKDRVPVVVHDATVERTTNGSGVVAEMTLGDLRKLDAGAGARIPTLADVLEVVGSRCHVDIEVKAEAAAETVLREATSRPGLRWAMSSFDHDVLGFVRARSGDVELWPLVTEFSAAALAAVRALASPVLAISDRGLTRDVVSELGAQGIGAWVWTVNDRHRARTLESWSVEGVCTDDPGAIMEAFDPGTLGGSSGSG